MVEFYVKTRKGAVPLKHEKQSASDIEDVEKKSIETISRPQSTSERGSEPPPRRGNQRRGGKKQATQKSERASSGRKPRQEQPERKKTRAPSEGEKPAKQKTEKPAAEKTEPQQQADKKTPEPQTRDQGDQAADSSGEARPRRRRRSRGKRKPQSADPKPEQAPAEQSAPADSPREEDWTIDQFPVEPAEGKTRFHDLDLPKPLMHAIADLDFRYCTPIQAQMLPHTLKGVDGSGRAQTGTGKSAAFLLTIMTRLLREPDTRPNPKGTPRSLIIAPTRELAIQIEKDARSLGTYAGLSMVVLYGGAPYDKQEKALANPIDIVIATPGRLLDFKQKRKLHLSHVEIMVIDEADRMLDMGFIPDVRKIIHSTPPKTKRQTMLFSATLTDDVIRLSSQWTRDPVKVEIEPESVASKDVDQRVYIVTNNDKFNLLYHVLTQENPDRALVFTNRRDQAERMANKLESHGINSALLSGAVPQNKRTRTLEQFRNGEIDVLVATDVAGRGLHIEGISHVINLTLPQDPEDYVHRIGRTGRAGKFGTSISFACEEDSFYIPPIEELLGYELKCEQPPEEWVKEAPPPVKPERKRTPRSGGGRSGGGGRGRGSRSGQGRSGSASRGRSSSGGGTRTSSRRR